MPVPMEKNEPKVLRLIRMKSSIVRRIKETPIRARCNFWIK